MKKLVLLVLLGLLAPHCAPGQQAPADLILFNGKIFTAESTTAFAEALAIRGGRIVAVGTAAEIKALAGEKTQQIDLQRRVVVPGFNDAHYHFAPSPAGVTVQFKSMEPTWAEVQASLKSAVAKAPPGTWIFGSIGPGVVLNKAVTRFALDQAAPDHPVMLWAFYGHGYIVNSKAMPLLNIAEEEPDQMGGRYERIPGSMRVNGRVWEYANWRQDRTLSARVTDEEAIKALRQMANEAIRFGITSVQIFPHMPVDRFAGLLVKADLPMRPTEAITRQQAVLAYTAGSAFAEFAESEKGTIAAGKRADVAVLSHDIFAVPTQELPALSSVLTLVDGKIVHDAGVLKVPTQSP